MSNWNSNKNRKIFAIKAIIANQVYCSAFVAFFDGEAKIQEANRDLFPSEATIGLYEGIRPLVVNSAIDDAFRTYENRATNAKRAYHGLGLLAILLISISAVYAIAEALIIPDFSGERWLNVVFGLAAALGIAFQLYLLITKQKAKWLTSRYACERLRSIKFQSFAIAVEAADQNELAELTSKFSREELAKLENELNAGASLLDHFRPINALSTQKTSGEPKNEGIGKLAFDAYCELRVSYQSRFAASEVHRLKSGQRYAASLSDILFLSGAGFVLTSLVVKVFFPQLEYLGNWIDFLSSVTFIAAIAMAILDHGGLSSRSQSRFMDYRNIIEELPKTHTKPAKLRALIQKMESAALEELRSFLEASKNISYRM